MYRENKNISQNVLRGDLYYADLSPVVGSEQGGVRPVLVIQNDVGNKYSPTVIVAAITSRSTKAAIPTHVCIRRMRGGLKQDSTVLAEQIRTIDRNRLKEYIGHLVPVRWKGLSRPWLPAWGWGIWLAAGDRCLCLLVCDLDRGFLGAGVMRFGYAAPAFPVSGNRGGRQ